MAKKDERLKLSLDNKTLLMVLEYALNAAIEQKSAAMSHHDMIAAGFAVDGRIDVGMAMAVKEISESLEKYLKSADASIDKLIKIARILSETMLRQQADDDEDLTDDEKMSMQEQVHKFLREAESTKGSD